MPTLQELRKVKFKSIKDFASAYGHSASTASDILHGKHQFTLTQKEVYHLAEVLDVSFEACIAACDASYAEFKGWKDDAWRKHEGLEALWKEREKINQHTYDWYKEQKQNYRDPIDRLFGPLLNKEIFDTLGVPMNASETQIKAAFRAKVKAAHDGKGGYQGDMDRLVQAKEQALKLVKTYQN